MSPTKTMTVPDIGEVVVTYSIMSTALQDNVRKRVDHVRRADGSSLNDEEKRAVERYLNGVD